MERIIDSAIAVVIIAFLLFCIKAIGYFIERICINSQRRRFPVKDKTLPTNLIPIGDKLISHGIDGVREYQEKSKGKYFISFDEEGTIQYKWYRMFEKTELCDLALRLSIGIS